MTGSTIVAMTDVSYVGAAWGGAFVLIVGYALATLRRGRKLSQRVPPEDRRWS
jgi:hypothetical protein